MTCLQMPRASMVKCGEHQNNAPQTGAPSLKQKTLSLHGRLYFHLLCTQNGETMSL